MKDPLKHKFPAIFQYCDLTAIGKDVTAWTVNVSKHPEFINRETGMPKFLRDHGYEVKVLNMSETEIEGVDAGPGAVADEIEDDDDE